MTPEDKQKELIYALERENVPAIRHWHEQGANINGHMPSGLSLLQHMALFDKPAALQTLLELGADVNVQEGQSQMTALHFAVQLKRPAMAAMLISYKTDLNLRESLGDTPLHIAARHGLIDTARALVDAGADVTAKDKRGRTAWQIAQDCADERFEFANDNYWAVAVMLAEAEHGVESKAQAKEAISSLKSHPYKNFRLRR